MRAKVTAKNETWLEMQKSSIFLVCFYSSAL